MTSLWEDRVSCVWISYLAYILVSFLWWFWRSSWLLYGEIYGMMMSRVSWTRVYVLEHGLGFYPMAWRWILWKIVSGFVYDNIWQYDDGMTVTTWQCDNVTVTLTGNNCDMLYTLLYQGGRVVQGQEVESSYKLKPVNYRVEGSFQL